MGEEMNIKPDLLKILREYKIAFDAENQLIAKTAYQFRRNMAQKEMSFDNFVKWLETSKI